MNKFFKVIPAALALVALASCSNDELFGEKANQEKVKDGLTVRVEALTEEGSAVTRQGNIAVGNKTVWEIGDQINVYDNKLAIYDEYAFNGTKFAGQNAEGATRIANTQFALFPADQVDYAGWTASEGAKAVMNIPQLVIYDEESEFQDADKNNVYVSNLPMWGTATGTYPEAEVDLHFLTSVLKINIKNAFANNITFLKVEAQDKQPISGAFEAILDAANPDDAVMKVGAKSLTTNKAMYVDLRNVPSYMTYIYLPIIARHYDYLKVGVTSVKATEASALVENTDLIVSDLDKLAFTEDPTTGWETIRNWEAGVDFTKASVKPLSKETQYTLDNIYTCEMLTKALQQYSSVTGTVELEIGAAGNKGLEITREGDRDDYTIFVPKMAANKVVINIPDGINVNYASGNPATLQIVDANIKEAFEGEIVLNAAEVKTTDLNAVVNLPKTDFTLAGDFNKTKALKSLEVKGVKTLTFGNGTDKTVIQKGAIVKVNIAQAVVVEDLAEVRTSLDLVNTKGLERVDVEEFGAIANSTNTATLSVLEADVHVQGEINNLFAYASASTVYIGEDVADGLVGGLYTIGSVEIANENESEAIGTELSVLGNNNITLKQGYIKKISYNNTLGGFNPTSTLYEGKYKVKNIAALSQSDMRNKWVKVTFAAGEGNTAIAEIQDELLEYTDGSDYYYWLQFTNKSTWGGEAIDAATYPAYTGDALKKIYTATELASLEDAATAVPLVLYNNVDLNNKEWTNPTCRFDFTGVDPRHLNMTDTHKQRILDVTAEDNLKAARVHTISNLKLSNAVSKATSNFGLFGKMTGSKDKAIGGFILDGVTCDLAVVSSVVPTNIGAIIGLDDNKGKQMIADITIKNAVIGGTAVTNSGKKNAKGIWYASTLIGQINTTGTNEIYIAANNIDENSSVTGQAYLGGLVGKLTAGGDVETSLNTVGTSYTVTAQLPNYDFVNKNFGTVGTAVGQFASAAKKLTIKDNLADKITNNREALGFMYNFVVKSDVKYAFHGKNSAVGFSPDFAAGQLKIGSQAYNPDKAPAEKVYESKAKSMEASQNAVLNSYIQWTPWEE